MDTKEQDHRTIGGLLREFMNEGRDLVQQEIALAKTEASEKASMLGRNVGYMVAGGAVAFAGALFLLGALSVFLIRVYENAGVSAGTAAWLGPLTVGLVVTIIGAVLVSKALKTFKDGSLKPEKTIQSVKEDKQWVKQQLKRA